MRITKFLTALVAAMGLGSAAVAGQCGYDYCWGAVGVGPNGAWAYSYGMWSEQEAYNAAQDECGWNCTTVKTFYNTCGAIARADNGALGWGFEYTRELAESTAINWCMDVGYNCRVVVWACSY